VNKFEYDEILLAQAGEMLTTSS